MFHPVRSSIKPLWTGMTRSRPDERVGKRYWIGEGDPRGLRAKSRMNKEASQRSEASRIEEDKNRLRNFGWNFSPQTYQVSNHVVRMQGGRSTRAVSGQLHTSCPQQPAWGRPTPVQPKTACSAAHHRPVTPPTKIIVNFAINPENHRPAATAEYAPAHQSRKPRSSAPHNRGRQIREDSSLHLVRKFALEGPPPQPWPTQTTRPSRPSRSRPSSS